MITYSTCLGCGDPMIVTDELAYQNGRRTHDGCASPPCDLLSRLSAEFLVAAEAGENAIADEIEQRVMQLMATPPQMLNAALLYASWGWPVFPLAPRSKKPAIRGGRGVLDASTDLGQVRNHWAAHPDHNIGLAAGFMFDVIDVDPLGGGIDTYHQALDMAAATPDNRGPLPDCHGKVVTAGEKGVAGLHLYIEPFKGQRNAVRLAPGVDIRARGGYVVAPPSTLGEHKSWNWLTHPSPMIKRR